MEVSELRQGNLIYGIRQNEDETKEIKEVCSFLGYDPFNNFIWVESNSKIEDFDRFEPIPITEEQLLKFKFKQSDNDLFEIEIFNKRYPKHNAFSLWTRTQRKLKIYISASQGNFPQQTDIKLKRVKYAHQLQNLYFALTGKELI